MLAERSVSGEGRRQSVATVTFTRRDGSKIQSCLAKNVNRQSVQGKRKKERGQGSAACSL
jgi:hypothetical protein